MNERDRAEPRQREAPGRLAHDQAAPPERAERAGVACPACGATNDTDAAWCEECGAALAGGGGACAGCGARNESGAAFCEECGASLRGAPPAVAAPAPVAQIAALPVASAAAVPDHAAAALAVNDALRQLLAKPLASPAAPASIISDAARQAVADHQSRKFSVHPAELAQIAAMFQQERQASATMSKLAGAVALRVRIRLWKCNYQSLLHNNPTCCAHPELGGVWVSVCEDDLMPASES